MIVNNFGVLSNVGLRTLIHGKNIIRLEPGYVFAPYIPIVTDIVVNFHDLNTIDTRYAIKIINNSYYGRVSIHKNRRGLYI